VVERVAIERAEAFVDEERLGLRGAGGEAGQAEGKGQ
jgi:hypothetical protein